jgi:hypothetical protein
MDPIDPGLVEVGIAFRLGDGGLVKVDPRDLLRLPKNLRGEREPARVTTKVEDTLALRECGQAPSIVPLIAEKTGLVALGEVDLVADAVFPDLHRGDIVARQLPRGYSFQARHTVVHFDDAAGTEARMQVGEPAWQPVAT